MAGDAGRVLVRAPKGTVLFREGEEGSDMYFVHSGAVRIQKEIEGKAEVLAVMEKGDFFGEMAVIEQMPRTATAVVEEEAELLKVGMQDFERLLAGNTEIALRMIRKYASRLRETTERFEAVLKDRKMMDREIEKILASVRKPGRRPEPAGQTPLAELHAPREKARFKISKEVALVGRRDPVTRTVPEIDLTEVDPTRSVSRRHARIQLLGGAFLLTEEVGVRNGTAVNGERLSPGVASALSDGAALTFGAVTLHFRTVR